MDKDLFLSVLDESLRHLLKGVDLLTVRQAGQILQVNDSSVIHAINREKRPLKATRYRQYLIRPGDLWDFISETAEMPTDGREITCVGDVLRHRKRRAVKAPSGLPRGRPKKNPLPSDLSDASTG